MDKVKESLNIEDGIEAFAIVPVGYPAKEMAQQNRYDKSRVHIIE